MEIEDFLDTVRAVIGCDLLVNVLIFVEGAVNFLANGHFLGLVRLGNVL